MTAYTYFVDLNESLPETPPDSIVSRTLHTDDDVKAVLFGFAQGQELSEHTASMPATIIILDGEADITLGDDHVDGRPGTWIHMPPNLPHSIVAKSPLAMLLLMVRSAITKEGEPD